MLYTNNNIDFKQVNKNLKNELQKLGLELSNSATLNLLSRAIGYDNYNTANPVIAINESRENDFWKKVNSNTETIMGQSAEIEQILNERDKNAEFANKNAATYAVSYLDEIVLAESEDDIGKILIDLAYGINNMHNHGKIEIE